MQKRTKATLLVIALLMMSEINNYSCIIAMPHIFLINKTNNINKYETQSVLLQSHQMAWFAQYVNKTADYIIVMKCNTCGDASYTCKHVY